MPVRGVRGAITVTENSVDQVESATTELLHAMVDANQIDPADIASCWLTTTSDVNATFPAVAARKLGWLDVPLLCAHEMDVPGSLGYCIRIMFHWNTEKVQSAISHIYLKDAISLRPDQSL